MITSLLNDTNTYISNYIQLGFSVHIWCHYLWWLLYIEYLLLAVFAVSEADITQMVRLHSFADQ